MKSQAKPFWIAFFRDLRHHRQTRGHLRAGRQEARRPARALWTCSGPACCWSSKSRAARSLDAAFDQALGYFPGLPERDLPQLIIVCDFARFRVTAWPRPAARRNEFALGDLHKHVAVWLHGRVQGAGNQAQNPVNIKAAERMGKLHDALKASGYTGHPLEVLLVRLLFCLFADDTGIFQPAQAFRAFIEERTAPMALTWARAGAGVSGAQHT
jgi:hypothetical protein